MTNERELSEPVAAPRPTGQVTKIDRIDDRGDIREHWTRDGRRTLCGIPIGGRQSPCGNRPCRRCEKIVARLSETTVCGVDALQPMEKRS